MSFTVLTIGWEPDFCDFLLSPIAEATGIGFVHGLTGDATRLPAVKKRYPTLTCVALSKGRGERLPQPDSGLLASLESVGVPTIRSMVKGDRVLRHLPADDALAYATLLARNIQRQIERLRPDLVLASFDSLHSGISLAVAKCLDTPWVAMAFPVIPDNLTGFCRGLTPDSLVPMKRVVDEDLVAEARMLMSNVRSKKHSVLAYRAPTSLKEWVRQYLNYWTNLIRRKSQADLLGIDPFTYPDIGQRVRDIARRAINRLFLPESRMVRSPPECRFAYYPFHMAPESMLDTWAPFYQDQIAFIEQCSISLPSDLTFVVKLHFSDPDNYSRSQLKRLLRLPRLQIAHPDSAGGEFLDRASLVIGIHGTSCLEASLLGKPVLVFGDSPYQHFPNAERAARPDRVHDQIKRLLDRPTASDGQVIEAYASYLARYMPGRINDWGRPIEADDVERLAGCFRALRAYIEAPADQGQWYQGPPFTTGGSRPIS